MLFCVGWLPPAMELTYLVLGCDNTVAVAALTKGYSSCPLIVDLVKKILELCATKNFHLQVVWVPGKLNAADPPSRGCPKGGAAKGPRNALGGKVTYSKGCGLHTSLEPSHFRLFLCGVPS